MNCKECFSGVLEPIAYLSFYQGCFSLHFSPYVFSEHIQIFICDACGSFYVKAPPGFASKIKEMCRIQNFSERGGKHERRNGESPKEAIPACYFERDSGSAGDTTLTGVRSIHTENTEEG